MEQKMSAVEKQTFEALDTVIDEKSEMEFKKMLDKIEETFNEDKK
jgi:hypothetical protein